MRTLYAVALLLSAIVSAGGCNRPPVAEAPTIVPEIPVAMPKTRVTTSAPPVVAPIKRVDLEWPQVRYERLRELFPESERFRLDVSDAPLQEILDVLSTRTERTLVAEEGSAPRARARFEAVTVAEALERLLQRYRLAFSVEGPVVRIGPMPQATSIFHLAVPGSSGGEGDGETAFWISAEAAARMMMNERGEISIDPQGSLMMVRDTPTNIERVEKAIRQVVAPRRRQVMIEAVVLEVELDDQTQYGIDWSFPDMVFSAFGSDAVGNFATDLGPSTGAVTSFGIDANKVDLFLEALKSQGQLNVLSSPRLTTMNRVPAKIAITEEVPYYTSEFAGLGNDVVQSIELEFRESGVTLEVIPNISGDGELILDIRPTITEVSGFTPSLSGLPPNPILDTREVQSMVRALDGETVVVAGLIRRRYNELRRGVPLLMDAPGIGAAFSDLDQQSTRTELVIVITPQILGGEEHRAALDRALDRIEALQRDFSPGPARRGLRDDERVGSPQERP